MTRSGTDSPWLIGQGSIGARQFLKHKDKFLIWLFVLAQQCFALPVLQNPADKKEKKANDGLDLRLDFRCANASFSECLQLVGFWYVLLWGVWVLFSNVLTSLHHFAFPLALFWG